jgi:hypothetical protein
MKLLTPTRPAELPAEALLARLRCRRAAIDLRTANHATEAPATDAVFWVYKRLNHRLRKRLEPFLDLLAMRSLILALRYTLAGESPPGAVLNHSLLTEPLKQLVAMKEEAEAIIAQLEAVLAKDYPFAVGLTPTYRNQGPGGVELQLADGILQHGLAKTGNDILKGTLRYLVDMRNCLMINKLWHWHVKQAPPLTAGGSFATTSLQRIWATHDRDGLARLAGRLAGKPLTSTEAVRMEHCLLGGLTRFLRWAGRDPLGLAVVIEYLWLVQLAVHNQVLRQALMPDREDLLEEVLLL